MKLTIIAGAYALTSDVKVEDIQLLTKYKPDALKIKDEDGNDKFSVGYTQGKPAVSSFGITFGGKNFQDGKATITKNLPDAVSDNVEKAKEFVAEQFGAIIAYLKQLEETIPAAAKAIRDDKKALVDSITLAE